MDGVVVGACIGAVAGVVILFATGGAFVAALTGPLWVIVGAIVGGGVEEMAR